MRLYVGLLFVVLLGVCDGQRSRGRRPTRPAPPLYPPEGQAPDSRPGQRPGKRPPRPTPPPRPTSPGGGQTQGDGNPPGSQGGQGLGNRPGQTPDNRPSRPPRPTPQGDRNPPGSQGGAGLGNSPDQKPGNNRNGDKFVKPEEEPEMMVDVHETIQTISQQHDPEGNPTLSAPDTMDLTFNLQDQPMTLYLKRNNHISPSTPLIIGKGQSMMKWEPKNKKSFSVYRDMSKMASIIMETVIEPSGEENREFRGSFQLAGDEYVIEPVPSLTTRRKRQAQGQGGQGRGFGKIKHMVYKKKRVPTTERYESAYRGVSAIEESVNGNRQEASRSQGAPEGVKVRHGVEMLMVIDFALYDKWYMVSDGPTRQDREEKTLYNIQYYYSHVANGVDMRYSSIGNDTEVYVTLAGLHVATTPDAAPFARDNRVDGEPRGRLESEDTLLAMADWLEDNRGNLPRFDQATLYTGDFLIGLYNDRILGLAFIGDICTRYSVSVNRDLGQYSAIQTTAHEMGHNLKALHDEQQNDCLGTDQYIMAAYPTELTNTVYKNSFSFSPCSQAEIKAHLQWLSQQGSNCLLDAAEPGFADWNQTISQLPGQRYSPTEQCRLVYGQESYYCGGATEDSNICRQMECFNPVRTSRQCYVNYEQRAASGTTCGNMKWCQQGDCVSDEEAPKAPDYCTYGDYMGPYKNGLSCKKIIEEEPWNCYSDYYRDDCCQSCAQLKNASNPGCEYGDRDGNCGAVTPSQCTSDQDIRTRCCHTCTHGGANACPQGDAASWCPDYVKSSRDCYFTSDTCCQTCLPYRTNVPGCEYGDKESWCAEQATLDCSDSYIKERCCAKCHIQTTTTSTMSTRTTTITEKPSTTVSVGSSCKDEASWCPDIPASSCYVVKDICCETCSKYYMNVAECEYGDHYSWCKPQYCTTASLKQECCVTCMIVSMTTTNLPSTTTKATTIEGVEPAIPKVCTNPDQADYCHTSPQRDCYVYEDTCCQTCTTKHFTGVKGCEYGDKVGWCMDFIKKPADCAKLLSDCCWSCRLYGISPSSTASQSAGSTKPTVEASSLATIGPPPGPSPSCSGPDLADWCLLDSELKKGDCYSTADTCCQSCQKHWTGVRGCEYGDRASWCDTYITGAAKCYSEGTTCCSLCQQYHTGVVGCEYGDKRSSCTQSDCQYPEIAAECCQTCGVLNPPSTATSTTTTLALATTKSAKDCGDHADWCPTIAPSDCYLDDYRSNTCCQTCAKFYRPVLGCEYGDMRRWCKTMDISQCVYNREECCDRCKDL